jgi:hypothetical protein
MRATLYLRIASVLAIIHAILHTIGGMLSKPNNGAPEIAIIEAMKSRSFNIMGSMRSYWDFFYGYGWIVAITLVVQGIFFWQLGAIAKTNASQIRPIVLLFCFNFLATTIVAWRYFFIAPAVTEFLIAGFLAGAYFAAGSAARTA